MVKLILEYRKNAKLLNTYLRPLARFARPSAIGEGVRIYPQWMQMTVRTGRLSCRKPNLQTIPVSWMLRHGRFPFASFWKSRCLVASFLTAWIFAAIFFSLLLSSPLLSSLLFSSLLFSSLLVSSLLVSSLLFSSLPHFAAVSNPYLSFPGPLPPPLSRKEVRGSTLVRAKVGTPSKGLYDLSKGQQEQHSESSRS